MIITLASCLSSHMNIFVVTKSFSLFLLWKSGSALGKACFGQNYHLVLLNIEILKGGYKHGIKKSDLLRL